MDTTEFESTWDWLSQPTLSRFDQFFEIFALSKIKLGLQNTLYLGNLNAKRDWGSAKDYVETMWLMLQKSKPSDYVIATGVSKTVKNFVEEAFKVINIKIRFIYRN